MKRDDIIAMAREAGGRMYSSDEVDFFLNDLEKFAALVAQQEREDCACPSPNVQKSTLRDAATKALEALMTNQCKWEEKEKAVHLLRAALAEPAQEPVAWSHNLIDNIITHRPADIDRHPDRWTALYSEPRPCPTCEALARTVMMDQTGQA